MQIKKPLYSIQFINHYTALAEAFVSLRISPVRIKKCRIQSLSVVTFKMLAFHFSSYWAWDNCHCLQVDEHLGNE